MRNNSKGFAYLFLVVLIVVIGIGGLIYYSWLNGAIKTTPNQNTSPTRTTNLDETTKWKTYREEKFAKFEFQYPGDWYLQKDPVTSYALLSTTPIEQFEYGILPKENVAIVLNIGYRNKAISIKDWCSFHPNHKSTNDLSQSSIFISDKQALKVEYEYPQRNQIGQHICVQTNEFDDIAERIVDLDFYYYEGDVREQHYLELFNQILSTFKFLD